MQKLQILNSREVKGIVDKLTDQFGFKEKLDYAFLLNEKNKVYIINRDVSRLDYMKLKIDKFGFYFGELKNEEFRLSMEGAWLIGNQAKKNIIDLNDHETKKYFLGENINKDLGEEKRFILLRYKQDIIGCAKYKEQIILNFLPKTHRVTDLII